MKKEIQTDLSSINQKTHFHLIGRNGFPGKHPQIQPKYERTVPDISVMQGGRYNVVNILVNKI